MPYPNDWNNAPEEDIDYGEEENLDVVEDDGLFSGEGPASGVDSSEEVETDDIVMEEDKVAAEDLHSKVSRSLFGKQDQKTGEIDDEDEEELLKEIMTKGTKYFEEHTVIDAKITKTEVEIHVESKQDDGEGEGEAMDISDDSGRFEELDENGAEILGIEKDLQDIEAQEDKVPKHNSDTEKSQPPNDASAKKAFKVLLRKLKEEPTWDAEDLDPRDGEFVPCDMDNERPLNPFGHVNFYPKEYELQAEFSDHIADRHRDKRAFLADESISPKNKKKSRAKYCGKAEFVKFGGTTPPFKSHEMTIGMPPSFSERLPSPLTEVGSDTKKNAIEASSNAYPTFPNGLPSPPLSEAGSDTRRNAIEARSSVSPPLSPQSTKQANSGSGKNTTGYIFGEKPPWYREPLSSALTNKSEDSMAVALADYNKKNPPIIPDLPPPYVWDRSTRKTKPISSQQQVPGGFSDFVVPSKTTKAWPPWMGATEVKGWERKGVEGLSIDSLHKFWETNVPINVNMFSSSFPAISKAAGRFRGQGPSRAPGTRSSQHAFGYENSNDPPMELNKEKDKATRDHVTSHTIPALNVDWTITTDSASHTGIGITLVRPARDKVVLFELPLDLERLLEHVKMLYPVHPLTPEGRYDHLSFRLIRVNVSDRGRPTGFDEIASMSDAFLDGGVLQNHYEDEIMPRLESIKDNEQVWVIRTFTRLWVQDGRDTSNFFKLDLVFPLPQVNSLGPLQYFFAQYDTTPDPPGCIKAQFDAGVRTLMGRDVFDNANVQVDRYKKEWLEWTSGMDDATFLRKFLWRIDDPIINIYPKNWKPHQSFEEAEEEREARRQRREQEAQGVRDMLNRGTGVPTNTGQNFLIGSQITQHPNEAERQHLAERHQELDRREHELQRYIAQLDLRQTSLDEGNRQIGELITELRQQRQTLNAAWQVFVKANDQAADRTASLNIQHQTLQAAGTCSLMVGAARCGRNVFGNFQVDPYTAMVRHWQTYHIPRGPRCQLHILCHTHLDLLSENELQEHIAMHQEAGQINQIIRRPTGPGWDIGGMAPLLKIQPGNTGYELTGNTGLGNTNLGNTNLGNTGGRDAGEQNTGGPSTGRPITGRPSTGRPSTGRPSTGGPSIGGPSTGPQNPGLTNTGQGNAPASTQPTPHPSGNPVDGPILDTNGLDPRSGLNPAVDRPQWICACGTNLTSMNTGAGKRAAHYTKCGYNDAHLIFRRTKDPKTPQELAKDAEKAETEAAKQRAKALVEAETQRKETEKQKKEAEKKKKEAAKKRSRKRKNSQGSTDPADPADSDDGAGAPGPQKKKRKK
ncbi:hypothetical protein MMC18_002581 [Xylographa bjoerkii]|nr:hypothetical protein [Xylographa bjoerkii]